MPKWLKITLILLAGAALLLGLLVGGAVWWFNSNKDRLVHEGRAAETAGRSFGATHAQSACVDDSLAQLKSCGSADFVCEAMTKLRLGSCLSVARSDDTCTGVPAPTDIMKGALWANAECTRRGQSGSQACGRLLRGVVESCDSQKRP